MVTQPTGVTVVDPTATGLTLQWTQPTVAPESYQIKYRVRGTTTWKTVPPVTRQVISGLPANTTLEMRISSVGTFGQLATTPIMLVTTQAAAPAVGIKAFRIADMMERFAVNTFSSTDPNSNQWGSYPADYTTASVIAALKWLAGDSGLTIQVREYHYAGRESWQNDWCRTVNLATGARFTMAIGANGGAADIASMMAMAASSSTTTGWMKWVENINEPNNDFGSGVIPPAAVVSAQTGIAVAAAKLANNKWPVTVVGPSIVFGLPFPEGYITPGYVSTAQAASLVKDETLSNAHVYPPQEVDGDNSASRGGTMRDVSQGMKLAYGGQSILVTEWHPTLYNTQGHGLDPVYDAYYAACFFLSAFREGVVAWFWFALFDYADVYKSGLFPKTGGVDPRPVAQTIAAMFALCPDAGATKATFSPGSLDYTVTGLPPPSPGLPNSGGQTMLFQASSGVFYLYIANVQTTPGGALVPVVVNLPAGLTVTDYKISDPTAPRKALQTTSTGKLTLMLDASVHVLVIQGATP